MNLNLIEFIKVFTIVLTFSSLLMLGHHYMWNLTEEEDEEIENDEEEQENVLDFPNTHSASNNNIVEPDFVDYDGMGNQGRFPEVRRR